MYSVVYMSNKGKVTKKFTDFIEASVFYGSIKFNYKCPVYMTDENNRVIISANLDKIQK